MYRYDEFDETIVRDRVRQFRGQVERRLSGDLTEDQFKPLRLMNGLYLQLHAYMLRVAIPYGTLSSRQLRQLAHIARKYDKGYGHFTTRQNIQYNWPALVDVPDILGDLADVEMHAIQTSGNCIRNVTSDQYAGATAEEIEDPRPWCEIIRQWSTFHPEFSYLPRKFKIAVTASPHDRAAVKVHDIGLILKKNAEGETGFEVIVGGGLGRTPYIGPTICDFLPKEHLLSYLEAVMRVYNLQGRRDNIYKARIKILVSSEGVESFRAQVEDEWTKIKDTGVDLPAEEIERIRRYFAPPAFETLPEASASFDAARKADPEFDRWARVNLAAHKQPGYAIVNISLKPYGKPPGDIADIQMEAVADIAERYSFDEIRATHEQNLTLPHVRKDDLYTVYKALAAAGLGAANIGLVTDIIACPGLDYCDLANARSIPIAERISERFAAKGGEEFYQITLGGSGAEDASLGEIAGRGLSSEQVVDAVERLVDFYKDNRKGGERFLDAYRRIGHDAFKGALYADAQA